MTCHKFYFPPHPPSTSRIRRQDLDGVEATGRFVAQLKYNGCHAVIYVGNGDVEIKDRRGNELAIYKTTKDMKHCFLERWGKGEWVFAGEVLHHKAKNHITGKQAVTDTIVLFDLLYSPDKGYLSDYTAEQRLEMLVEVCGNPKQLEPRGRALEVNDCGGSSLWLAETFYEGFEERFVEFLSTDKTGADRHPEIEGLILRQKDGMLLPGDKLRDVTWLIRVRKKKPKVYEF